MGCRCRITVGVGVFLIFLSIMDSCVSFLVSPPGVEFLDVKPGGTLGNYWA